MVKTILLTGLLISNGIFAQQQLENANFELWENVGAPSVEPEEWSSLKTADALASSAPTVIDRDNGRSGAGYCIKLETKSVFGIAANGIATNGRVHADFNPENGYVYTDAANPQWHTIFTARPDSLVGWYKYAPTGSDKGKVEIALHTGDGKLPGINPSNFIASARANFVGSTNNEWLRFSVPVHYASSANPQYVLAVISSGDSTMSQNGSKLWVDDLQFIYNPSSTQSIQADVDNSILFFNENQLIIQNFNQKADAISIYNLEGKLIATDSDSPALFVENKGIYLVRFQINGNIYSKKVYKD